MYNTDSRLDQAVNPRLDSTSSLWDRESEETMPDFTMAVRHRLSRDDATARIKNLLQDVKEQYAKGIGDIREEWGPYSLRFSFKAIGHDISGVITVGWFQVKLEGEIPQAAVPLQRTIEHIIREQAQMLLS
jgi:Putative polyhydroxyalkanoic acid system protein (PHA_gran_rgn)